MTETLKESQDKQQTIDITSIQKDIEFMKDSMSRNFIDHTEIKTMFQAALKDKVTVSRFRPVEMITFGLSGGVLFWALSQLLNLVTTAKAALFN